MRHLRIPLLLLSLLFLTGSLYTLLWSDRGGGSLVAFLHEHDETPEERQARDAARRTSDLRYAARLRADGLARVQAGDFENGRARLDDAARIDPPGEWEEDVVKARNEIRAVPVVPPSEWQ